MTQEKKTDLRIIKTHKALCDTFLIMLSEQSFESITVNDLCDKAMVRRATFYKHFADKYDFFSFFIRDVRTKLVDNIANEYDDTDPNSYYLHIFREFIQFLSEHQGLVNSVVNSSAFPTLLNILSDEIQLDILLHLQEQKEKGKVFPMPLSILAAFYAGGIVQISRYCLTSTVKYTTDELVEHYASILNYRSEV